MRLVALSHYRDPNERPGLSSRFRNAISGGPAPLRVAPAKFTSIDPLTNPNLDVEPVHRDVYERLKQAGHCSDRHGSQGDLFISADPMEMAVALADCRGCPVKAECLQVVQPRRSYFDGVCAGLAWLDGIPVQVGPTLTLDAPVRSETNPGLLQDRLRSLRPPRPLNPQE